MLFPSSRQNTKMNVRFLLTFALTLISGVVVAHYAPSLPLERIASASRQFGLPFAGNPGPNTWLLGQLYGNTTGAFRRRNTDYSAGQGIHFGMDFGAPCGTKVLAIGAGVIAEVDGPHGSAPHNLVINHDGNLSSLYGHLQFRSKLRVGQRVKKGDVIGLSGDSQFTCISAPHLHLELRDRSHQRFLNPVPYIAADWDSLALIGAFGRGYQRDLSQPRRWQSLLDQPAAQRGGRLLNRYAQPWPPTLDSAPNYPKRITSNLTTAERTSSLTGDDIRLTKPGCCVSPFWSADSQRVLFIDKPDSKSATVYAINTNKPDRPERALSSVALLSPSQRIAVMPAATSILERLSDGRRVRVPSGANIFFSRSETQIAWSVATEGGRFDTQANRVYTAKITGKSTGDFTLEKPKLIASLYGGGTAGWLNENELLLTGKTDPKQRDRSLRVVDLRDQGIRTLTTALNIRGLSINPTGTQIAYYVAFDSAARNGMYVQDVRTGARQRLDWIGSYRWRDSNRLVYVPLEASATHRVLQWDVRSKQSESLVTLESRIAGDDWQVAPNGSRIVFFSAADRSLRVLALP
jgi:hypothetical protein